MTLTSQDTADTARAGRLAGLFRNILNGNRKIRSSNDAKLFFEAARAQAAPSSCIEAIIASKHGIEALQLAVRVDLSVSFLQTQTLQFLAYLDDAQLSILADGQILQRALVAVAKPATFWNELVTAAQSGALDEEAFRVFSWLCFSLLSLPETAEVDIVTDVVPMDQSRRFLEASSPETRKLGYKIQRLLQLQMSPNNKSTDGYSPGGRHDNDFVDFRKVAVYPTTDEFLSNERPFYRQAKEVFETDILERAAVHLDNTYRLTREDLLGELRSDWQIAQGRKSGKRSALTLRKLWPAFLELGDEKARKKCSLALRCGAGLEELGKKLQGARKKWLEDNKNYLRHQAFGALYQGQEIFGFAFVNRDINGLLESPPVVILQFADNKALKKALLALRTMQDVRFTLVDTPVFAYEPVLERLKDMKELPLQEQLLDASQATDDFIPHTAIQVIIDRLALSSTDVSIEIENGHVNRTFQLDCSQRRSLINALSRKVSVIQGPPGTLPGCFDIPRPSLPDHHNLTIPSFLPVSLHCAHPCKFLTWCEIFPMHSVTDCTRYW